MVAHELRSLHLKCLLDCFCICGPSGHWSAGHSESLWWGILFFQANQGQYCWHERRNWEDCISLHHKNFTGFVCFRSLLTPSKFMLMGLFTLPWFRSLFLHYGGTRVLLCFGLLNGDLLHLCRQMGRHWYRSAFFFE